MMMLVKMVKMIVVMLMMITTINCFPRSPTGSNKGVGGREGQQARVPPSGQLTEGQVG